MIAPVMKLASSESRKAMLVATSSDRGGDPVALSSAVGLDPNPAGGTQATSACLE